MNQKALELAKALKVVGKDPEVYIASAFFDESSREWVSAKEKEFQGIGIPYFSPREDGLNFNEVEGDLRAERIRTIFKNNVRNLKTCKHICINLTPCNGKLDIGTLWELGYFLGYHDDLNFEDDDYNTLAASPEIKDLVLEIIKNLKHLADSNETSEQINKLLLIKNLNEGRVKDSLDLIDANYEVKSLSSTLSGLDLNAKKIVFVTDEWPMQSFILMGWLYAREVKYYTASFKGYGSNVMVAASSKGHIQLPGLVDDTYSQNLK